MPVLDNTKHELFAQALASGCSAVEAYIKAGYKRNEGNAIRLKGNEKVLARVEELKQEAAKGVMFEIGDAIKFLVDAIKTPIGEIDENSVLCQEYTIDQIGGGANGKLKRGNAPEGNEIVTPQIIRKKVKGLDKLRAVDMLAKFAPNAWYAPEKKEVAVTGVDQILNSIMYGTK